MNESTSDSSNGGASVEPKKFGGYRVLILLVLLAAAIGLRVIESRARGQSQTAYDKIDGAIANGQSLDLEQVHEMMGRDPSATRNGDDSEFFEEYHYRGAFKARVVEVKYRKKAATLVEGVSLR